jgi:tetratricopeptide (TPR) repeat protein
MERDKQQLESLHQQASALYLQGEYVAALEAWSQLLKIDPDDERAREGVRLCELLVEEEGGAGSASASGNGPKPGAATGSAPALGMGIGEDLDEELDELDEMLGGGEGKDWMDAPTGSGETGSSSESPGADDGIDFDLSDVPSSPQMPAAAPTEADGAEFNFEGTDRQATSDAIDSAFDFASSSPQAADAPAGTTDRPPAETAPAPAGDSRKDAAARRKAAEELQNRTNELMAEALEHYEKGDREAALGALSRISILDENNEAARTFADHIRNEMEAAQPQPSEPSLEGAAGPSAAEPASATHPSLPSVQSTQNHEPLDLGEGSEAGLGIGDGPQRPAEAPVTQGSDPFDPFADSAELTDAVEQSPVDDLLEIPDETPSTPVAVKPSGAPPTRWLLIAAGVLVLVGGVYVALQLVGSQPAPEVGSPVARNVPPPSEPGESAPTPADGGSPAETGGAAPVGTPAALDPEAVNAALDRGDRAFEAEDYAAAVLAYNEALKLDPENEVAKRKLGEAGDRFREQKETLDQRRQAIQAFNDGNYRNALRLFYRLEPTDEAEQERFTRARLNGWFNLGLQALKTGDCRLAQSHFKEAQSIDPLDRGLRSAMDLNARCFEGQDQAYFDTVRGLRFRGLDD